MKLLSIQTETQYGEYALYAGCLFASIALIWLIIEWKRYKDYWDGF